MESISRMAEKCRSCKIRDKCDKKRMEACAYFDEPMVASASMPSIAELAQPVLVKHDYRDVKIGENTTVTIDLEELKKKINDDIYKSLCCGFNYGA